MLIGRVEECVWATKKNEQLDGYKLLVITTSEKSVVAVDMIGAGVGDKVLVSTGSSARLTAGKLPVDAAVVGIIDLPEVE